jgi:hypothetical protein
MLGLGANIWGNSFGRVGAAAYPEHTRVIIDGNSDAMSIANNPFGTNVEYFSAAFWIDPAFLNVGSQTIFHAATTARIYIPASSSGVAVSFAGVNGPALTTPTQNLLLEQPNCIQIAGRCAASSGNSTMSIWINGVLSQTATAWGSGGFAFQNYNATGYRIFSTIGAAAYFKGGARLAWITTGATSAHYITPSTYDFWNGGTARNLGATGNAPGVTPIVFYGGTQTYLGWQAGTNQGSGSNWTSVGEGPDIDDTSFDYYVSNTVGVINGSGSVINPNSDVNSFLSLLSPGDRVGFRRGETWTSGSLPITPSIDGTSGNRIVFGAYGVGAKPIFDCEQTATSAFDCSNRTYLRFDNLQIQNQNLTSGSDWMKFGAAAGSAVHDIELYGIVGVDARGDGDDGIFCSRNVNLYLEDCSFTGSDNHLACHPSAGNTVNITALNCTFTDSGGLAISEASGGSTVATLTGCTFDDCFAAASVLQTGSSLTGIRCTFISTNASYLSYVLGETVLLRYCLIDYTGMSAGASNLQFCAPGAGDTFTAQNCTFLGLGSGTSRGDMYADDVTGTLTLTNCNFVRWWRLGYSISSLETASYCYIDGLTGNGLDSNTNAVTTAGYCNLTTGRPDTNLTTTNKGTNLGLGALTDLAGDTVTVATPTRGCYENAS